MTACRRTVSGTDPITRNLSVSRTLISACYVAGTDVSAMTVLAVVRDWYPRRVAPRYHSGGSG